MSKIISKCSELAQRDYKIKQNWMGRVIHWELFEKFKFNHTNKCYSNNSETVLKMRRTKVFARRRDLVIVNKKKTTCWIVDFAVPADSKVKLEDSEKGDNLLKLAWEVKIKNLWNMKVTLIPIVINVLATVAEGLVKGLEDLKIREGLKIIQNTVLLRSTRILWRVLET